MAARHLPGGRHISKHVSGVVVQILCVHPPHGHAQRAECLIVEEPIKLDAITLRLVDKFCVRGSVGSKGGLMVCTCISMALSGRNIHLPMALSIEGVRKSPEPLASSAAALRARSMDSPADTPGNDADLT